MILRHQPSAYVAIFLLSQTSFLLSKKKKKHTKKSLKPIIPYHPLNIPNLNLGILHVLVEHKKKKKKYQSPWRGVCASRGQKAKSRLSRNSCRNPRFDGRVPLISVVHTHVYTCAGRMISADKTSLFNREVREARFV